MLREKCPLRIVWVHPVSKGRVAVYDTQAVVYRTSNERYFVTFKGRRFRVRLSRHMTHFRMVITTREWFMCFPREEKIQSYG